jgi:hypothetical protein
MEREEFFRMKKIQAKKKRDREVQNKQVKKDSVSERQPDDGRPQRSLLDQEDDLPVLFT